MSKKAWGGRFSKSTHKIAEKFSESISFDKRLYEQDIEGSIAHVTMLAKKKIISTKDSKAIIKGLKEIHKELESGKFKYKQELEDIHLNIERRLIEKIGDVGGKIHTARSRNDQVIVDTKLYMRKEINEILNLIADLSAQFINTAEKNIDIIMPLYTHMQRGQPVLLSHHMMAYFEMLKRDHERFSDCLKRLNLNPLGSGAGAGTSFQIDRKMTADLLAFDGITKNSIDTVSDRDYIAEFIFCSSALLMHLSRLSEEFVLWSTKEFDFIDLGDEFTTGSSIMPQKRNPDMSELTRGKIARVYGNLNAVLTLMKGLPLSYNRDMQEDKEPLFDTVDTVKDCLNLNIEMLKGLKIKAANIEKTLKGGFITATDIADYLAKKGMPFRNAHEVAGKAVAFAEKKGIELEEMEFDEIKKFSPLLEIDIFEYISVEGSVESRSSYGGTSTKNVKSMIKEAKKELNKMRI
ncbi:MAG: argininosuccinate lyase [Candidatus Dadabacteria bacterium]|nr:argininosuccinate lyase [Candidatus Dadabacteria bacterium]NIQ13581.1 argininosuccinate lyase [Candidatus Dadabacteria bacterium]